MPDTTPTPTIAQALCIIVRDLCGFDGTITPEVHRGVDLGESLLMAVSQ